MTGKNLIYLVSFIALITVIVSCDKNKIIPRDKMVEVLHDIQIVESIIQQEYETFKDKGSKDALVEGVLKKHGITQAQLDSSLVWYSDNIEIYLKVNDSVLSTLKREDNRLRNEMLEKDYDRRDLNFSILPKFSYLTETTPTLTFDIDSLLVQRLPDFEIELRTLSMQKDMDADFSVSFFYIDTTLIFNQKIKSDGSYNIARPEKSEALKYISGYIHLNTEMMKPDRKLLLYDISVRDSIKVAKIDSTKISQ